MINKISKTQTARLTIFLNTLSTLKQLLFPFHANIQCIINTIFPPIYRIISRLFVHYIVTIYSLILFTCPCLLSYISCARLSAFDTSPFRYAFGCAATLYLVTAPATRRTIHPSSSGGSFRIHSFLATPSGFLFLLKRSIVTSHPISLNRYMVHVWV